MCFWFCISEDSRLNRDGGFEKVHLRVPRLRKVERGCDTEWERNVRGADMPTAKTDSNRPVKVAKSVEQGAVKVVVLVSSDALAHVAKDNTRHFFQQP